MAMANPPFEDVFPIQDGIFHCYVCLPEGNWIYNDGWIHLEQQLEALTSVLNHLKTTWKKRTGSTWREFPSQKETKSLPNIIFRGYVSFREGIFSKSPTNRNLLKLEDVLSLFNWRIVFEVDDLCRPWRGWWFQPQRYRVVEHYQHILDLPPNPPPGHYIQWP